MSEDLALLWIIQAAALIPLWAYFIVKYQILSHGRLWAVWVVLVAIQLGFGWPAFILSYLLFRLMCRLKGLDASEVLERAER